MSAVARLDTANLAAVDTDTLKAELRSALSITVDWLRYIAAIWSELEGRGVDLSDLTCGVGKYVAKIAAGVLLPETVEAFAGQPKALERAAKLPVDDQRACIASGVVPKPLPKTIGRTTDDNVRAAPDPVAAARLASAGDVAEMVLNIVRSAADPIDVARRLLPQLEAVLSRKARVA